MVPGTIDILGFNVFSLTLKEISVNSKKTIINTINAYSYVISKQDTLFKQALTSSDILLPDGFPIVYAAKLLQKKTIQKIAGEDIFFHLINEAQNRNLKCFFLGSSNKTLQLIKSRINKEYPNIRLDFYSPPYVPQFSEVESDEMKKAVSQFKPDILFIGMTAPKQEKWVFENQSELDATVICSIGAVFDFFAGTVKRPSNFWINLKLEWFVRLLREPKRLWKRYLIYSPIFFADLILAKLKLSRS